MMEFSPNNNIVKLCLKGMILENSENLSEAENIYYQAYNDSSNEFEKFLSSYFIGKIQTNTNEKLKWFDISLNYILFINDESVKSALPNLYLNISKCYETINDLVNSKSYFKKYEETKDLIFDKGPFYHGTKADLKIGDLLIAGFNSNYKSELTMNHIYFTALKNGAGLAASLAKGEGRERIYIVEPSDKFEPDPNLTDKKFPGNLTRSYRTVKPLKIIGEITDWMKISNENLNEFKTKLNDNNGEIIN